jgi:hypothetical protein
MSSNGSSVKAKLASYEVFDGYFQAAIMGVASRTTNGLSPRSLRASEVADEALAIAKECVKLRNEIVNMVESGGGDEKQKD